MRRLVLLATVYAGCNVELTVPTDLEIGCAVQKDCPEGFTCVAETGRCVSLDAPTVVVGEVQRSVGQVEVPVTVYQADGRDVSLEVAFDAGGGFVPATATGTTLAASRRGEAGSFFWDAAADLRGTTYAGGLRLRLVPTSGDSRGKEATSGEFAFGNAAPVVEAVALELGSGDAVQGIGVVRVSISDSSADAVDLVAFELSLLGDFSDAITVDTAVADNFPGTTVTDLGTAEAPIEHVLVWDASRASPVDAATAAVRLKVKDEFVVSDWGTSPAFALDNAANPPELLDVSLPSGDLTPPVSIDYTVVDLDDDACSVLVEYSLDGTTFTPAASESQTAGLFPGDYTFVWQSSQLGFDRFTGVFIRLRVSDALGVGDEEVRGPFVLENRGVFPAAPRVTVGSPQPSGSVRFLSSVPLPITVSDANEGVGETVSVRVRWSLDYDPDSGTGTFADATLAGGNPFVVPASAAGAPSTVTWLANDGLPGGPDDLPETPIDLDLDGTPDGGFIASSPVVWLELSATDSSTQHLTASSFTSLALGNDPPTVSAFAVPGSGDIAIAITVADAFSDTAWLDIEFRQDVDDDWRRAKIALGVIDSVATNPLGAASVVLWDSSEPPVALDEPPTLEQLQTEQGIGAQNLTVDLRLRAHDTPATASRGRP